MTAPYGASSINAPSFIHLFFLPPAMTLAIRHRGRSLTFESACEEEGNLLLRLQHEHAAVSLRRRLWTQRDSLANLVRHQLGLGSGDACELQSPESWLQGAFNVCIPVEVMRRDASTARFILRCPMPHKLAEDRYPGTIDEKVSCEAASYVWMQEHCNDIRIPHLYAFGFADGRHVRISIPFPTLLLESPPYSRLTQRGTVHPRPT